jgi:hypothetical protein
MKELGSNTSNFNRQDAPAIIVSAATKFDFRILLFIQRIDSALWYITTGVDGFPWRVNRCHAENSKVTCRRAGSVLKSQIQNQYCLKYRCVLASEAEITFSASAVEWLLKIAIKEDAGNYKESPQKWETYKAKGIHPFLGLTGQSLSANTESSATKPLSAQVFQAEDCGGK